MIEFSIVLPLILIFFFGALSTGRLLSYLATGSQATFLGAVYSAQQQEADGGGARGEVRTRNIMDLHNIPLADAAVSATYDHDNALVTMDLQGELKLLFVPLSIHVQTTAPYMLLEATSLGDLSTPDNPCVNGCYTCNGQPTSNPPANCEPLGFKKLDIPNAYDMRPDYLPPRDIFADFDDIHIPGGGG